QPDTTNHIDHKISTAVVHPCGHKVVGPSPCVAGVVANPAVALAPTIRITEACRELHIRPETSPAVARDRRINLVLNVRRVVSAIHPTHPHQSFRTDRNPGEKLIVVVGAWCNRHWL